MSHKSALQQIVALKDDSAPAFELLMEAQRIAREALAEPTNADAKKVAQDTKRAQVAIAALESVLANPVERLHSHVGGLYGVPAVSSSFLPAVEAELIRMRAAVGNPEALRAIYHRNEVRR